MTRTHDKEVNKISECELLYDTINPPKQIKILNIHHCLIIHEWMNTRKVKAKFDNFLILLDSGCSYTMLMVRLVKKLHPEKYTVMQCHT